MNRTAGDTPPVFWIGTSGYSVYCTDDYSGYSDRAGGWISQRRPLDKHVVGLDCERLDELLDLQVRQKVENVLCIMESCLPYSICLAHLLLGTLTRRGGECLCYTSPRENPQAAAVQCALRSAVAQHAESDRLAVTGTVSAISG
jgi:hypothetical protein